MMSSSAPSTPGSAHPPVPPPSLGDDEPEDMFIDEVHEYLKCSICLCVLKNPYQVTNTTHTQSSHLRIAIYVYNAIL